MIWCQGQGIWPKMRHHKEVDVFKESLCKTFVRRAKKYKRFLKEVSQLNQHDLHFR
jgi:hypothetical protein